MTDAEIIEIIRAYAILKEKYEKLIEFMENYKDAKCGRNQ